MLIKSPSLGRSQRGVGLMEVLIAILILAIGVLGYSALQIRAVEATTEALNRSQAMLVLRGLAENVRANAGLVDPTNSVTAQSYYQAAIQANNTSTTAAALTLPFSPNCDAAVCSASDFAKFDANQSAYMAYKQGILLNMDGCPGDSNDGRKCLFASWGKTQPTIGSGTTDCITSTGVYNTVATCVMMEAY